MPGSAAPAAAGAESTATKEKFDGRNHWIKAGLSLEVTAKVVAPYVAETFRELHGAVLADYPGGLAQAASDAAAGPPLHVPKCESPMHKSKPSPTCRKCVADSPLLPQRTLAIGLVARHGGKRPTWANSNAQLWGTPGCHIEMAKLYCSPLGDHTQAIGKTGFEQLDSAALFNMLNFLVPADGSVCRSTTFHKQ
jgi:hypothetical protein